MYNFLCSICDSCICVGRLNHVYYMFPASEDDRRRPPSLVTRPVNHNILAGETATLECSAAGVPTPVISWSKEGE